MIFGGNIPDYICNKVICKYVRLMFIQHRYFKFYMRLKYFPFQRCNNWNIANRTGCDGCYQIFAILHQITCM